ncbi:MAG: putative system TPR-repeat lipoprotein [Acidobacteria bacterium]|nr:putative system TPR-repeat lipoprotein [Acidobacteriota bacterium]
MKVFLRVLVPAAFIVFGFINYFSPYNLSVISAQTTATITAAKREEAYRANNLGVALLEQFNHKEGAEAFRRALAIDPQLKIARVNLAIALFNVPDYDAAIAEAQKAAAIAPEQPQPVYILGLIARAQNRIEDAVAAFKKVLEFDPNDVGANVNLGQIYVQQRKYSEAVAAFRLALEAEPYNTTALYNLATALLRSNGREEGQQLMTRFQTLRQSGAATNIGLNYLEQGRYAEAVTSTGAEPELVEKTVQQIVFQNANIGLPVSRLADSKLKNAPNKPFAYLPERAATLFDFDNDGDLDLAEIAGNTSSVRLYRNDNGKYVDATRAAGDLIKPSGSLGMGIVAGDYDNDGFTDLLVFGGKQTRLYRNTGKGVFKNETISAKIPATSVTSLSGAFADADHDGDLDVFLAGFSSAKSAEPAASQLLRNNGDGTFTDVSDAAKIKAPTRAVAVIPTDFDNRRDVDFLVLNYEATPQLWRNMRDGSFQNVASEVGLNRSESWTCAAVGDYNKDNYPDFFFGRANGVGVFAVSDGRGKFTFRDAPRGTENAASAQFLDYDNDGLLDLIVNTEKSFVVSRNMGNGWTNADSTAFVIKTDSNNALKGSRQMLSGDVDGDGDVDLLTFAKNGSLHFVRNAGGEKNNSEIVRLTGRVSNKTGIGAKIDMRAGSLTQKLESYSASPAPAPSDIHFGLGKREKPDAIRVIWTSGVIQAEVEFPEAKNRIASRPLNIEELDRKPSSCPYLYTWNGEKFEFISDFLGGGEMAYSHGNGQTNTPDPEEYVRITSEQLKPRNGRYELRVTNELEEVLYLDRFELIAVDHRENTEIYPNEGLGIPTADKFILYTTGGERAPLSAFDGKKRDVTKRVRALDRNFYDSFENEKIRGYAKPHELVLTLDDRRGYNGRTLLLLTGWTDYAFSSDNVAAAQSGLALQMPKLQVRNKRGEWETVIESIGISVGRPQTVVVDLTGKFLSDSREVRIQTNMKTLWDKIAVDTSADASANLRVSRLEPRSADLRERGFSLEVKPDGKEPVLVDYNTVLNDGRWKYFSGSFTRLGSVLPLLSGADDVFVISKTGDELALAFDEKALPPLEKGMKRTFLLRSIGYSKEMDINSASPDAVMPLPFRAMSKYPYGANEQFPMSDEKRKIYDEYTTRIVKTVFPRIETALIK